MQEQEQEVEVSFCDLCGESVPAGDISSQLAMRYNGKTIGGCCLVALKSLMAAASAPNGDATKQPGQHAQGVGPVSSGGSGDSGRSLTVAIVMIVAFIGGIMFLDSRLSGLEEAFTKTSDEASTRQKGDSEALQALSIKADGFANRAEVAAVVTETKALAGALAAFREVAAARQRLFDQEVGGLRTQLSEAMAEIVDYRPLFEDLRQRHARAMTAIEGMRRQGLAEPVAADPSPVDLPAVSKPMADLPDALAEQVRKLASADPAVRFEAVDVLAESKNLKVLPYLLPLAKDPDAFVRRLTVEGLREFSKPETVDALIEALRDEDENVCDTAWRSLRDLTSQKLKFDASASREGRARAAQVWQAWWAKARAGFGS